MAKIPHEIKVEVSYAETIQAIINGAEMIQHVNGLFVDLFEYDKIHKVATYDNVYDNLSIKIETNTLIDEIRKIVNGLIEENKKLKEQLDNFKKES
jgi:hypothetical protein